MGDLANNIPSLLALLLASFGLGGCGGEAGVVTLNFWGLGREGEVVAELVREFERENPGIRVEVQQIPWIAAHEKLLTAHVGNVSPDVAQIGNTWISEFVALDALQPLDRGPHATHVAWGEGRGPHATHVASGEGSLVARSEAVTRDGFFDGIWDTNVIDGRRGWNPGSPTAQQTQTSTRTCPATHRNTAMFWLDRMRNSAMRTERPSESRSSN